MTNSLNFAGVFPGQGSQYPGMCSKLLSENAKLAEVFKMVSSVLGIDLREMMEKGIMKELTKSKNAQPLVLTASYVLFSALKDMALGNFKVLVGHSLGELSAFVVAGGIGIEEAVLFARRRGEIMDEAQQKGFGHAGIVLDVTAEQLEKAVKLAVGYGYVTISGYNSPRQYIVAGTKKGLSKLDEYVSEWNGHYIPFRMMPMKMDAPYHSPLMEPLREAIASELENLHFNDLKIPVFSTVTASVLTSAVQIKEALLNQITSPVLWTQALEGAGHSFGLDFFVDIGPNIISKNLIDENPSLKECLYWEGKYEGDENLIFSASRAQKKVRTASNF